MAMTVSYCVFQSILWFWISAYCSPCSICACCYTYVYTCCISSYFRGLCHLWLCKVWLPSLLEWDQQLCESLNFFHLFFKFLNFFLSSGGLTLKHQYSRESAVTSLVPLTDTLEFKATWIAFPFLSHEFSCVLFLLYILSFAYKKYS